MKRVVFSLLVSAVAVTSHADDWYLGVQAVMGRVEQASDQTIWLSLPLSDSGHSVTVSGESSTCTISQIHLIPPAGEVSAWLAMALSALAAGKPIDVYGTCNQASYEIDASRLVIDFP